VPPTCQSSPLLRVIHRVSRSSSRVGEPSGNGLIFHTPNLDLLLLVSSLKYLNVPGFNLSSLLVDFTCICFISTTFQQGRATQNRTVRRQQSVETMSAARRAATVFRTSRASIVRTAEHHAENGGGFLYVRCQHSLSSASRSRPVTSRNLPQRTVVPGGIRSFVTSSEPQKKGKTGPAPKAMRGGSKVFKNADEAVADIQSGSTILSAGFGLCGTAGKPFWHLYVNFRIVY
jgi:hypothetical protein